MKVRIFENLEAVAHTHTDNFIDNKKHRNKAMCFSDEKIH